MKNKIRYRLFFYFAAAFVVFSILISIIFTVLFSKYNVDLHKSSLEDRAVKIADTFSTFFVKPQASGQGGAGQGGAGQGSGYGAYLRFLDDIAMADVWVIDPNLEQVVRGYEKHKKERIAVKDLPEQAEMAVNDALMGKTSFTENFSSFLGAPSVTVATPIVVANGDVAGVVLLHTQIDDISAVSSTGLQLLLLSMGIAIVFSFGIAGILSLHFTKPLEKMKQTAMRVSKGDFSAKTGIAQNDEIGELAYIMDEMALRLGEASKESEKLEQLRRDFIANISHELRTPITVLRGSLEALCDGIVTSPEMVDDYHRQMLAESIHLERMVADLLDLSKLQNPDFNMDMQLVDIGQIAEDAAHSMQKIAQAKHISLSLLSDRQEAKFCGDYGRLRQMLIAVLSNAIKFSSENSSVQILASQKETHLTLVIADTGCGIAPQDLPHIFDRFYKQRSEQNKDGTGLGLAIAKQIADRHGIDMYIESALGEGTTVTFGFDLAL